MAADAAGRPPAVALAAATAPEPLVSRVRDGRLPDDSALATVLMAADPALTSEPVTLAVMSALAPAAPGPLALVPAAAAPVPARTVAPAAPEPAAAAAPVVPAADAPPVVRAAVAPVAPAATAPALAQTAPPAAGARFATQAEVAAALARSPWPEETWPRVIAIAFCESGVDSDHDGRYDVVDTQALGAGGLYIGALQISREHRFPAPYDLYALADNLAAGYELWLRAGRSFVPWGCA